MNTKTCPTLFLDRDGTINEDMTGGYVTKPSEFALIEGAAGALVSAKNAGFKLAIITNQQGIGKGVYTVSDLAEIHDHMTSLIREDGGDAGFSFDEIQFSPHLSSENSPFRKPGTKMIEVATEKLGSDLKHSFFIGDKDADLLCAHRAGIRSILVLTGYGKETMEQIKSWPEGLPVYIALNLADAVEFAITNR